MQAPAELEVAAPVNTPLGIAGEDAHAGTYVTFDLSGQVLGVAVRFVREILDQVAINRLPNSPSEIEGVIDIRGESIPIVDMGSRLGLRRMEDCEDTRIIVFEIRKNGVTRPVGVLADRVRDVTQISLDAIEDTPEVVGSSWDSALLRGLARHGGLLILLLNMDRVFDADGDASLDSLFV